jgi:tetratricopeptide (TPR) repeat protein
MDPITRSMHHFADQAEAFWRAHPRRLLPLAARENRREDMVQALRLYEARAENRRPFIVFRAPFELTSSYFSALTEQIARDYERVRTGVIGEGIDLPAFLTGDDGAAPSGALKRAALAMHNASHLLGKHFAGIVIALVPDSIADTAGWAESIRTVVALGGSARVRLAVLAPPGGPLSEILRDAGASFNVDSSEVLAFLKQLSREASAEPETAGVKLRALLLAAAESMGTGCAVEAAALYAEARSVCQAEGLVEHEAAVLMALGSACLAAKATELGATSYHQAAILAEQIEAWPLACQAWLGMGGAYLLRQEYAVATVAYRTAAKVAKRATIVPLHVEALRMAGTCLSHLGRHDEAKLARNEAVSVSTV